MKRGNQKVDKKRKPNTIYEKDVNGILTTISRNNEIAPSLLSGGNIMNNQQPQMNSNMNPVMNQPSIQVAPAPAQQPMNGLNVNQMVQQPVQPVVATVPAPAQTQVTNPVNQQPVVQQVSQPQPQASNQQETAATSNNPSLMMDEWKEKGMVCNTIPAMNQPQPPVTPAKEVKTPAYGMLENIKNMTPEQIQALVSKSNEMIKEDNDMNEEKENEEEYSVLKIAGYAVAGGLAAYGAYNVGKSIKKNFFDGDGDDAASDAAMGLLKAFTE